MTLLLGLPSLVAPVLLLLALPFGGLFAFFVSLRLEIDEQGISCGVPWLSSRLSTGARWRDVKWASQSGVLRCAGSGPVHRRGVIDLRLFDSNWQIGPIGRDVRRWAPELASQLGGSQAAMGPSMPGAKQSGSAGWAVVTMVSTVIYVPLIVFALLGLTIGGKVGLPVTLLFLSAPLVLLALYARISANRPPGVSVGLSSAPPDRAF